MTLPLSPDRFPQKLLDVCHDDPMETTNLAATNAGKRKSLLTKLDGYFADVDAQLALPHPDYDPTQFSGGIRDPTKVTAKSCECVHDSLLVNTNVGRTDIGLGGRKAKNHA